MKRSDRLMGFGAVEIIIIIAIVAILSALGVVGYNAFIKKPTVQASASDIKDAQSTAQAFYAAYTNSQGKGADILAQYGTANLITASKSGNKNYSPIVCAQNIAPASTSTATYKDGHFIVPVTLNFSTPLKFTVEVVKSGDSFKIDKVNCPPEPDLG